MDSSIKNNQLIIYQTEDGKVKIETHFENETVWLNIDQIAELFQKFRSTINEHIFNVYKESELDKESSMRKIGISDFSTKPTNFYNLFCYRTIALPLASIRNKSETLKNNIPSQMNKN